MKLSMSLPDADVEFIDRYASDHAVASRSGVVQHALSLLRASELGEDYAAAWDEWESSREVVWEETVGDGLSAAG
jgi:Arc/MetJ-type ribon-helix-helix transcriptional regulator